MRADPPSLEQLERELSHLRRKNRRRQRLRRTLGVLTVLMAVLVLLSALVLPVLLVQGESMEPTLRQDEAVICIRGSRYGRGDIVAFSYGSKILIKRIIAGPGDTLDMDEEGNVLLNGTLLSESYVGQKAVGSLSVELPCTVPEGHWFLMGDNRAVSVDSRSSLLGFVSEEQITGRVFFKLWPLRDFEILAKN